MNNDAGAFGRIVQTAIMLSKGQETPGEDRAALPPLLRQAAEAYAAGRHMANHQAWEQDASLPGILSDLLNYFRMESSLKLAIGQKLSQAGFEAAARGPHVPGLLRDYYLGLAHYRAGRVAEAYAAFSRARPQVEGMVVKYGRFSDGSVRGLVSARSLDEFEAIARAASPERADAVFPFVLDSTPPRSRRCHIVGCDAAYWVKYRDLFLTWAATLSRTTDIWVHCTNFPDNMLAGLKRDAPFAFVSTDRNDHTNVMPYYTMTRFILAEKLARTRQYQSIVCSDIDIFVVAERYESVVAACGTGCTAIYQPRTFPWRSSDAKFSVWKGADAQRLLGWIVAYFCDTFRPGISGHNRQWWIDQFALALVADIAAGASPGWALEPVAFHRVERAALPLRSPLEEGLSKDAFVARFAQNNAA